VNTPPVINNFAPSAASFMSAKEAPCKVRAGHGARAIIVRLLPGDGEPRRLPVRRVSEPEKNTKGATKDGTIRWVIEDDGVYELSGFATRAKDTQVGREYGLRMGEKIRRLSRDNAFAYMDFDRAKQTCVHRLMFDWKVRSTDAIQAATLFGDYGGVVAAIETWTGAPDGAASTLDDALKKVEEAHRTVERLEAVADAPQYQRLLSHAQGQLKKAAAEALAIHEGTHPLAVARKEWEKASAELLPHGPLLETLAGHLAKAAAK
jgi:hypothetical protein